MRPSPLTNPAPGASPEAGQPPPCRPSIEALAARQHGVVSRSQLLEVGVSSSSIARRVRSGYLTSLHAGVYRVGPLEGPRLAEMAAVLAGGPSALLSHGSALRVWGLAAGASKFPLHLTVIGRRDLRRPGLVTHRVVSLRDDERSRLEGVPITSPLRTLVDAAGTLGSRELARAMAVAERRGLVGPREFAVMQERYRGHRGMVLLRSLVDGAIARTFTRSEAEERCLALLREAGLPPPHTNVPVGPYELALFWPDANVAVEVDGWAHHGGRPHFENDRRKDNWLRGRGIDVVRLTWRQITREPIASAVQVGQALALAEVRRQGRVFGPSQMNGPAISGHR